MPRINIETQCLCGNNQYKVIKNNIRYLLKPAPLCLKTGTENLSAKIIQCTKCNTQRTFPVPITREYYNESDKGYKYMIENEILWRKFADDVLNEIKYYKTKGELLDVGCGVGILTDEANKRGYQASGLEINPAAAKEGSERYNLTIFNFPLEQLQTLKKRWDVIVLNHVMEHLLQPVQFLSVCQRLLKEDGIIYIGVPFHKGWTAKTEGKDWMHYFVDQHIWHWTKETIKYLVERAGLSVIHIHCRRNNYYHFGGVRGKIKKLLYRFFEMIGKGDQIIIIVR